MADYVYHGKRYWTSTPNENEHIGWNTDFVPCPIFKVSEKRIGILSPDLGVLWLNRLELEKNGKVYHSRPHEYFYREKPVVDPEKQYRWQPLDINNISSGNRNALSFLGLSYPTSKASIKKAYKAKAKQYHPDKKGSHDDFLKLQKAYKEALETLG